jgi:hypothetical protein
MPSIRTISDESENHTIQPLLCGSLCRTTFSQLKISRDHHVRPERKDLTPLPSTPHQLPPCHNTQPGSRQHHFRLRGIGATNTITRRSPSPRKTLTLFPTQLLSLAALLPMSVLMVIARPAGLDTRAVTTFP